ncbi:MAG: hydroxyacid dehydrogenase [Lautropia sp.]
MTLNIVRTDLPLHPIFDETVRADSGFDLAICPVAADPAAALNILEHAHAFHLWPAKDEVPTHLRIDDVLLARCRSLLVASSVGAGYDTIDVDACTRAGVAVVNQAGGNAVSVAEMTLGLMLSVGRRIAACDRFLRQPTDAARTAFLSHELAGSTLGLIGIGHVGSRVARLARAFDLQVLASDPYVDDARIRERGAEPADFDAVLARADYVSVHCPLTDETRGLFDSAAFARMKQGAIFINTARGFIHDERALQAALSSGHLAGAGLDVWDVEPPRRDHPLLAMDHVVGTWHLAGVTFEARKAIARMGAEQLIGMARGERPPRLINPQVWPTFLERLARANAR